MKKIRPIIFLIPFSYFHIYSPLGSSRLIFSQSSSDTVRICIFNKLWLFLGKIEYLIAMPQEFRIVKAAQAVVLTSLLLIFSSSVMGQKMNAKELNDLAWQLKSDHTDSAMQIAVNALDLSKREVNETERGRSEKIIGVLFWFKNELDSALVHYGKSLHIFKNIANRKEIANLYNNISVVFDQKNLSDTSLYLYQQALEINLALNDSIGIAQNYTNIGVLYGGIGDDHSYLRYSKLASLYAKSRKDILYSNIAGIMTPIYGDQVGLDSAIYYYRLALRYCESQRMKSLILLNMGPYFRMKGFLDSAAIYLERGTNLIQDKSSSNYVKAVMDQGGILFYEQRYDEALVKYFEVNELAEIHGHSELLVSVKKAISWTYVQMGRWKSAFDWEIKYREFSDSLENLENRNHLATLQEQFEYEQNQRKIGELRTENLNKEVALSAERNTRNIILFLAVGLLLLLGVMWLVYRRSEERKKHSLEKKRLEIEQRMLRSQMNPHFIFNALNSIQSFIATNKTYDAEVFMSKFSMLVRRILENSTHEQIALEDEVETLQIYLALEKLRFEERFDFEIVEDADLTLPIPPMLLQPFIENAILHGMKGKTSKGHIWVRFIEEEKCLVCEVEDDGVGRQIKATSEHKSLATTLTDDRINYFNEASESATYSLEIIDKTDAQGESKGTKVVLTIPLEG